MVTIRNKRTGEVREVSNEEAARMGVAVPRETYTAPNMPEPSMNSFMAGVTGFNTGVERLTQGALQPLLGRTKAFQEVAKQRELDYNEARRSHPFAAGAGEFVGQAALGLPFAGGGAAAVASKFPQLSPYVANILGSGLGGAAFGGLQYVNPDESRAGNAATGAFFGSALGAATPLAGKAAKSTYEGLRGALGSKAKVAEDMLANLTKEELERGFKNTQAAKRLGVTLTPAEATGSKLQAKYEGKLGISPENEKALFSFKDTQKTKQQEAINNLLGKISPEQGLSAAKLRESAKNIIKEKTEALQEKARPFYEAAERATVSPNKFNNLTKDGNIQKALEKVTNSSEYKSELQGYAPNSIKVLDLVKRSLDDKINTALRQGQNDRARVIAKSRDKLISRLDELSPDYKTARGIYAEDLPAIQKIKEGEIGKIANLKDTQLKKAGQIIFDPSETDIKVLNKIRDEFMRENPDAWKGIIKDEMQRKLVTKNLGKTGNYGSNFYENILANDRQYKQFYDALKGDRSAQMKMRDMKSAFKDLLNSYTVKTAGGQAKSSLDVERSTSQYFKNMLSNLAGGKYDKAAIEMITNPKWDEAFRQAAAKRDKKSTAVEILKFLDEANRAGLTASATATEGR
jgi:hypothetical protein